MTTPLVRVRNLWVSYGDFQAVRGISFDIPKGEVFGFIGPNGAGKTSTIRVLSTLQKPRSGRVLLGSIDAVENPSEVRPRIGYVPDSFGVYEDLTVEEYLHFFAAAYRIPRGERADLIDQVLGLTDLSEKLFSQVEALSRGMKQRLNLARVLLHDPELLLLDEPASGLDPRARVEIREFLKELQAMGKTILISSHILHELAQLCTQVGIIEAGQMIASGPIDEIYRMLEMGQVVRVSLTNETASIVRGIQRIAGVQSVQQADDGLRIEVRTDQLPLDELLDRIVQLGGRIALFHPQEMDMETAFLKLTEGRTA